MTRFFNMFLARLGAAAVIAAVFAATAPVLAQTKTAKPVALDYPKNQKLIAAAKAEGKLLFYGTTSVAALKSDADAFQQTYAIPMTFTQLTTGPMTARVDQEIRAGRINPDVIISSDRSTLYRWIADGQMAKLPDMSFPQQTEYMAPIQSIYQALFYNTAAISKQDVPRSWNDLLNPKYAGKIILGSPRVGTAYSLLYLAMLKDPKYGEAFFEKLAAQKARVVQTNPMVAQLTASGEAVFGFTGIPYDATNVIKANPGAPINYVYLDIVTMVHTYVVINARAQNPNAAKLFAAWLMSPAGQVANNGDNRASSLLGNLPGTLAAPDPKRVRTDVTVDKVTMEYQTIISTFDRIFK